LLLAEAIVSVISSPGRRAMGEAGRRRVETGFSREAAVAKTEALLERLVHVMM
jgi:glycosyltransferase involved in cell wall biosynthesis